MLFDNTYNEIFTNSFATYSERGSKFLAYAFCVYSNQEIKKRISIIKKKEPSASHYCYAYVLHPDKSVYRMNDDGEPSSTAGRQIFKEIQKLELTNILIIVVRYFGGVKLGIPGLIRAYKTSSSLVLQSAKIVKKNIQEKYIIEFDHPQINNVMKIIKEYDLKIIESNLELNCNIHFLVNKIDSQCVLEKFKSNHKIKIIYQ